MNRSTKCKESAGLAGARRLGRLGISTLLCAMLGIGGVLPAQAAPAPETEPSSGGTTAPAAAKGGTAAAAGTTAPAEEPGTPAIDMDSLRAEMGQHGSYMGQGAKTRAASYEKQHGTRSTDTLSTQATNTWMAPGIQGLDVSSHQPTVNWPAQYNMGARFAYVKATEGTTYRNPVFGSQYAGASSARLIRGAYHFALPNVSSAAEQANYFVNNGGGWTPDGKTMPPLLDIEYNPYASLGNSCYNMSQAAMVSWIKAFSNQVLARTGRLPMIYTTTDWWQTCTGNSSAFSRQPLHLAAYSRYVGAMPNGWATYSVWQYSATGPFAGDSNAWNGTLATLQKFASTADGAIPAPSITSLGDVVAADSSGVLWDYPATGNGTLTPRRQIGRGWTDVRSVNAIDWNADGVLDLVAQWTSGRVNVYLGVAAGGFATGPVLAASGWSNYQLTIGYWLRGSYFPHIITRDDSGVLRLWRNSSGAGLGAATTIGNGWSKINLTMIDFDGDGNQDILGQDPAGTLRLYRSGGNGAFVAEPRKVLGGGWHNMTSVTVTTNFKGSGTNGLMARSSAGQLTYYPVPGNSAWGAPASIGSGWNGYLIAGGENINLEVAPPPAPATPSIQASTDVVTVNAAGDLYRHPTGTGTIGAGTKIGAGFTGLASTHVTDWNADGLYDLATVSTGGALNIHFAQPAGGFTAPVQVLSGLAGAVVTIGPWQRAAKYPGVIVRGENGTLQYYPNDAGKMLGQPSVAGSGFVRMHIVMTDADGDGNQDIAAVDHAGVMRIYRSNGTGSFIDEPPTVMGSGWNTMSSISPARAFASATSNGLLARDRSGQLFYYPLVAAKFGTRSSQADTWNDRLISGSANLVARPSLDGTSDILTIDAQGKLWNNPARGSGSAASAYLIGAGWSGIKSLHVVDWNSDGVADVLAQRASGSLAVYVGGVSGGFAGPQTLAAGGFAQTNIVVGPWLKSGTYPGLVGYGADGVLHYWGNRSGTVLDAPVRIGRGWNSLTLAMIDFDADGNQDLLAVDQAGAMRLYRSNGQQAFIAEPRRVVGAGWQSFRQYSGTTGLGGSGTTGLVAVQPSGLTYYYPVLPGGTWDARTQSAVLGQATTVSMTTPSTK